MERLVYERFQEDYDIWIRLAEVELERARTERVQEQVFLLVMTLISFITAVFGVFAVIYVMIYSRRLEMGMMKAIGARNWELNGMLSVEVDRHDAECGAGRDPCWGHDGLSIYAGRQSCGAAPTAVRPGYDGHAVYYYHGLVRFDFGHRIIGSPHRQAQGC